MKSKTSRRAEAARKRATPAAESFVHSAADKVGPLAQSAADKVGPLAQAVAERMSGALDRMSPYAQSATDRLAQQAQQAVGRVNPYAQRAYGFVEPYAQQASERVSPFAQTARQRSAQVAQDALERLGPRLDEALDRVSPAVEAAQKRMHDELLPKLIEALSAAAATPVAVEDSKRGRATIAAGKDELVLAESRKGQWLPRLAIIAAAGGVAVFAARKFLGSKDADWQAAKPTTPYAAPKPAAPAEPAVAPEDVAATNGQVNPVATDDPDAQTPAHVAYDESNDTGAVEDINDVSDMSEPIAVDAPPTEAAMTGETGMVGGVGALETEVGESASGTSDTAYDSGEMEDGTAPDADRSKYSGGGVYVGHEPPEGFTIKGNERSMKYHVPESAGYFRTISEVWFNSEEAAEEAGFVRAQR